ncbi:(2Fe-2S) ferredoxin domain-containing protein [Defluviitalea phaphyphila]|uniref:(2Fe-2S) ferredoxin domain-containing protein n=1 Tax=Defluviitalea phaphyphila TaxID=1473580 RepID=UPI000ABA0C94|nr:NAD(P)H-dependent oxidoreductase subunit E [Defluviitalea phaphyphila]
MIVEVCIGSACHLKGAYEVVSILEQLIKKNNLQDKIIVKGSFCLGNCTKAVSVRINNKIYSVQPETVQDFFEKELRRKVEVCKL